MAFAAKNHQKGASMVEMALVITTFLGLVFAVFEFSLAVFYASRLSEATRAGARTAIVNMSTIDNVNELSCDQVASLGYRQCSLGKCGNIIEAMNKVVNVDPSNVYIRYQCATTGYTKQAGFPIAQKEIYSITVKLQAVQYPLIVPGILGLQEKVTMPSFETTRLSEDLWSKENL